jgi:hypothetical protein
LAAFTGTDGSASEREVAGPDPAVLPASFFGDDVNFLPGIVMVFIIIPTFIDVTLEDFLDDKVSLGVNTADADVSAEDDGTDPVVSDKLF